jgi:short-subunit dehydrogenase
MKVFITGSSRGFGLEMARAFARKKYDIVLNGRSLENGYDENGFESVGLDMVLLNRKFFALYAPDIIINNGFDKDDWLNSFKGQLNVLKESYHYFISKGSGTIINVNSSAGINPYAVDSEYVACKHGLRGYSESINDNARAHHINIIDLYPGAINTGMSHTRDDFSRLMDAKELADFVVTLCDTKTFVVSSIVFKRTIR